MSGVRDGHVIVVDLGFGDAGKGATVDWLCSRDGGAPVSAVVRFNGGAQAAHNVIAEGRHHTFAQFGSGTFSDVPTLLSRHMLVEPIALAGEARQLAALGVADPLRLVRIDGRALLTTPIHIAANRAREDARGSSRHGSCGRGIGETARYALEFDAPRVEDCLRPSVLAEKLRLLAAHYGPLIAPGAHRYEPIADLVDMYREFAAAVRVVGPGELAALASRGRLIFEGAQGVLLDEWRGFPPHTTWSTVEPANARALLAEIDATAFTLGVTRTYATRHGAGPFPTEDPELRVPEPHNTHGPYQGSFRRGHADPLLLRYAVAACGGVDGLAVTHLDAPSTVRAATAYRTGDGVLTDLPPSAGRDLDRQRRLTDLLYAAEPVLAELPADRVGWFHEQTGVPVVLTSDGADRAARVATSAVSVR
ncbi:adenylosuccinate synthetase [Nocardia noduli]|uniref:adenylosuccinate synthetase n=1 Tax=Nocardia noduli TaxID=2815722 RepID=UPI0020B43743|nr:adenylosuccinate synthetase [Nocardia noduli]